MNRVARSRSPLTSFDDRPFFSLSSLFPITSCHGVGPEREASPNLESLSILAHLECTVVIAFVA